MKKRKRPREAIPWPLRLLYYVRGMAELSIAALSISYYHFGLTHTLLYAGYVVTALLVVGGGFAAFVQVLWVSSLVLDKARRSWASILATMGMLAAAVSTSHALDVAIESPQTLELQAFHGLIPLVGLAGGVVTFWLFAALVKLLKAILSLLLRLWNWLKSWVPRWQRQEEFVCPCCQYQGPMRRKVWWTLGFVTVASA
ncbi:MAG: hypothetical protein WAX89_03560 [Alphaproteobacteria bacterium]